MGSVVSTGGALALGPVLTQLFYTGPSFTIFDTAGAVSQAWSMADSIECTVDLNTTLPASVTQDYARNIVSYACSDGVNNITSELTKASLTVLNISTNAESQPIAFSAEANALFLFFIVPVEAEMDVFNQSYEKASYEENIPQEGFADAIAHGTGTLTAISLIADDPHITGPHGEKFDFIGQSGGVYALFSSRRFVLNTRLDALDRREARFMLNVALIVGNVTITFDAQPRIANYVEQLNGVLAPHGAKASTMGENIYQLRIEMCRGQSVVVSVMRSDASMAPDVGDSQRYLNVELDIAGCDDDFGGIIGQMYQCKFGDAQTKFAWDGALEETFRVPALNVPSGAFRGDGKCLHQFGTLWTTRKSSSAK